MILDATEPGHALVNLTDGNGRIIKNCQRINTETGEAVVYVDLDRPNEWPKHWSFGEFIGWGGTMRVNAVFALPIVVTTSDDIVIQDELQLGVANRFDGLKQTLNRRAESYKRRIEDGFINIWAELGRAKAGICR